MDAAELDALCERVLEATPAAPPDGPTVQRVMRFLDDVFAIADVDGAISLEVHQDFDALLRRWAHADRIMVDVLDALVALVTA